MGLINAGTRYGSLLCSAIALDPYMGPKMRQQREYYTIVYVLEGEAYYRDVNGFTSSLTPGSLMIVFPDFPHNYNAVPGGHWKPMWFTFDQSVFAPWKECGLLDPSRPIHRVEPFDYWFKRFKVIYDAYNSHRCDFPMLMVIRFQEILLEALYAEEISAFSEHDLAWADQVRAILDQETDSLESLPDIAQKMGLPYETFRKRFTHIVGVSPIQYRNRALIERACRLMRETHLNNKEIAYRLGFYDEFHFSRRFKQILGFSPTEFRKNLPLKIKKS